MLKDQQWHSMKRVATGKWWVVVVEKRSWKEEMDQAIGSLAPVACTGSLRAAPNRVVAVAGTGLAADVGKAAVVEPKH